MPLDDRDPPVPDDLGGPPRDDVWGRQAAGGLVGFLAAALLLPMTGSWAYAAFAFFLVGYLVSALPTIRDLRGAMYVLDGPVVALAVLAAFLIVGVAPWPAVLLAGLAGMLTHTLLGWAAFPDLLLHEADHGRVDLPPERRPHGGGRGA